MRLWLFPLLFEEGLHMPDRYAFDTTLPSSLWRLLHPSQLRLPYRSRQCGMRSQHPSCVVATCMDGSTQLSSRNVAPMCDRRWQADWSVPERTDV